MIPAPTPARSAILRALRISLHVLFAALLTIGTVTALLPTPRGLGPGPARWTTPLLAALLAAAYLAGTVWEARTARGAAGLRDAAGARETGLGGVVPLDPQPALPARASRLWLAGVLVLWVTLMLLSPAFAWVAFPLMFLALHLLPAGAGLAVAALLWVGTWALPVVGPLGASSGGDDGAPARALSAAGVLGPLIGTVIAVVISWAHRGLHAEALRHQRTAETLRLAQDELARREKQAGRFEERERISRDIHDTLAQGLSSILLISRAASAHPAASADPRLAEQLGTIESVAAENLAEARRFVRELAAPGEQADLIEQLRALCTRTESAAHAAGSPLRCLLRLDGSEDPERAVRALPAAAARTLLRAAQASLANVTAHAQARTAVVTLALWETEAALDVYDDGRGFQPTDFSEARTEAEGDSGYGLPGLARRIREAGGSLSVESAPSEGTVVAVRLPLTSARESAAPSGVDSEEVR